MGGPKIVAQRASYEVPQRKPFAQNYSSRKTGILFFRGPLRGLLIICRPLRPPPLRGARPPQAASAITTPSGRSPQYFAYKMHMVANNRNPFALIMQGFAYQYALGCHKYANRCIKSGESGAKFWPPAAADRRKTYRLSTSPPPMLRRFAWSKTAFGQSLSVAYAIVLRLFGKPVRWHQAPCRCRRAASVAPSASRSEPLGVGHSVRRSLVVAAVSPAQAGIQPTCAGPLRRSISKSGARLSRRSLRPSPLLAVAQVWPCARLYGSGLGRQEWPCRTLARFLVCVYRGRKQSSFQCSVFLHE